MIPYSAIAFFIYSSTIFSAYKYVKDQKETWNEHERLLGVSKRKVHMVSSIPFEPLSSFCSSVSGRGQRAHRGSGLWTHKRARQPSPVQARPLHCVHLKKRLKFSHLHVSVLRVLL